MTRDVIYYIGTLGVFLILQVLFFSQLNLLDFGFCFIYVGFFLMLPYDLDRLLGLIIGFAVGFLIDTFYQSGGIHIAASVFLMFIRPGLLSLLNPKGGFELGMRLTLNQMGWSWYLLYSSILVFAHHLVLYSLDAFSFSYLLKILLYAGVSTIFSIVMILTVQFLLFSKART